MLASYPHFSETLISLDSRQISIDAQKDFSIIFNNTQEIKLNYNQVISLAITSELLGSDSEFTANVNNVIEKKHTKIKAQILLLYLKTTGMN